MSLPALTYVASVLPGKGCTDDISNLRNDFNINVNDKALFLKFKECKGINKRCRGICTVS